MGAALLTVLLIVAVMAVLAAAALERLKLATRLAQNGNALLQAQAFARSGETVALHRIGDLLQDTSGRTTLAGDWEGRPTNFPIDGGLATAQIDDAGNCFNLNSLVTEATQGVYVARPDAMAQFARLMTLIDVPGRDAQEIAAAATDWIDSDSTPLPGGGAEDDAYAAATPSYRTGNTLMADVSELRVVAGVTPAIYTRLRPFLCALPVISPTVLNIDTLSPAKAPLLAMLLPGVDTARAASAIAMRPAAGWDSMTSFWNQPALAGTADTGSARARVALSTRWFDVALTIELADAEFEDHVLVDAQAKPGKIARRSFGERS